MIDSHIVDENQMMPVPIGEFIAGMSVPVDLFVRLGEDKFVLIARAGQKTQKDQLASYKSKTVNYLWVKKAEYSKITQKTIAIAGVVVNQDNLDAKQKTHVVTKAARSVFREFSGLGLSPESYAHAQDVCQATVTLAENHKDLADLFESLNECSDELLRHSMAVSVLSVLIGQAMGWNNKVTLEKLALGALLHDIGKKGLPKEILKKPTAKMTYDELQIYETHPYKGMQMMVQLGVVPDDVVSIVYEHHENSIGQGFPQRLRNMKIHPMARVVALANAFANLTVNNSKGSEVKNPREALMIIEHTMGQPYNKDCFNALKAVVNKEPMDKKTVA